MNSKMFFVYYICNYATNVTLNDAVVAHLYPSSVIFYHWALVKEYSKNQMHEVEYSTFNSA
jgi:hypothetical protein